MRQSRSPASSYCIASGRDSSDWDVWAFRVKPRLKSGMPYLGLEFSTAQTGRLFLGTAICTKALDNGLLHVDVVREVPEAAKPRTIKIGTTVTFVQPQVTEQKAA